MSTSEKHVIRTSSDRHDVETASKRDGAHDEFDSLESSTALHMKVDTTLNVYTQVLDSAAREADRGGSELFRIVQKSENEAPLTH